MKISRAFFARSVATVFMERDKGVLCPQCRDRFYGARQGRSLRRSVATVFMERYGKNFVHTLHSSMHPIEKHIRSSSFSHQTNAHPPHTKYWLFSASMCTPVKVETLQRSVSQQLLPIPTSPLVAILPLTYVKEPC